MKNQQKRKEKNEKELNLMKGNLSIPVKQWNAIKSSPVCPAIGKSKWERKEEFWTRSFGQLIYFAWDMGKVVLNNTQMTT